MPRHPGFDRMFVAAINVLRPYLDDVVCIGGCANALYRLHRLAADPAPPFLGTFDGDIALPSTLPQRTKEPLAELMMRAGFVEETFGSSAPPCVKYRPANEAMEGDIEFLCPLSGSRGGRRREPVAVEVQPGLMAQPLRYLEVLSENPWRIDLSRAEPSIRMMDVIIRVPNPAAYVLQKVLIRDQGRPAESKAKDCYYIYEVSVLFRDSLSTLAEEYERLRTFPSSWFTRFKREASLLFRDEHAEGPTSALDVYGAAGVEGPRLSAKVIHMAVARMLRAFGIP